MWNRLKRFVLCSRQKQNKTIEKKKTKQNTNEIWNDSSCCVNQWSSYCLGVISQRSKHYFNCHIDGVLPLFFRCPHVDLLVKVWLSFIHTNWNELNWIDVLCVCTFRLCWIESCFIRQNFTSMAFSLIHRNTILQCQSRYICEEKIRKQIFILIIQRIWEQWMVKAGAHISIMKKLQTKFGIGVQHIQFK